LDQSVASVKTFQTEAEDGVLVLRQLPFAAGERVAVTIASPPTFQAMRAYAEGLADHSGEFAAETEPHVTERLLRETEW
jgi:hypothetical protein